MLFAVAITLEICLFSLVTIACASHGIQGIARKLHIEGTNDNDDNS